MKEIVDFCGGVIGDDVTIKMGGPQMGFELCNLDVPVIKGTKRHHCHRDGRLRAGSLHQMRTLRRRVPDGASPAVLYKIRRNRELAGHEGAKCDGLYRMQMLRQHLFVKNSDRPHDKNRKTSNKGG